MKNQLQKAWEWFVNLDTLDSLMLTVVVLGTAYMLGEHGFETLDTIITLTYCPLSLARTYQEMKNDGYL